MFFHRPLRESIWDSQRSNKCFWRREGKRERVFRVSSPFFLQSLSYLSETAHVYVSTLYFGQTRKYLSQICESAGPSACPRWTHQLSRVGGEPPLSRSTACFQRRRPRLESRRRRSERRAALRLGTFAWGRVRKERESVFSRPLAQLLPVSKLTKLVSGFLKEKRDARHSATFAQLAQIRRILL